MANLTALAAARHAVLARAGWDVEAKGLFGAPAVTVVVGDEAHPALFKALGLLGLGRDRVVRVPVDGQGRMRADALPAISGPAIVCLQAGNVNTGAVRPPRGVDRTGPRGRRLGPRGRRVRPVGGGGARARAPRARDRDGRLLGHGRAQVAQRPLRQRARVRPRPRAPARGDGPHRRLPPDRPCCESRRRARPSSPGAPAASRSGRCCARSGGPASPTSSSATAATQRRSPSASPPPATRSSTRSC